MFEYMKVRLRSLYHRNIGGIDVSELNELGGEGWQLVAIEAGEAIFMRETTEKSLGF